MSNVFRQGIAIVDEIFFAFWKSTGIDHAAPLMSEVFRHPIVFKNQFSGKL